MHSTRMLLGPLLLRSVSGIEAVLACLLASIRPFKLPRENLAEADVAYVYGSAPKSVPGRRVIPAQCISQKREASESEFLRKHPRNRTGKEAQARMLEMRHPMPRHVKHMRWLIEWHSDAGEVVCDPFLGSGTCGVAAANLGRPFVGIEIDPEFFS